MNGRRAREQHATHMAKLRASLAAMNGATPNLVGSIGGQDQYMVGTVLVSVPVLRDDYPDDLKDAIDRRRRAGLTGRCDCGAERHVTRKGGLQIDHEYDCTATDDSLNEITARHGMTMRRAF